MNPRPGDPDVGEPIGILRDQEMDTTPRFVEKVRRTIYRRTAASQLASYSWHLPKVILVEMASLLGHLVKMFGTNKES